MSVSERDDVIRFIKRHTPVSDVFIDDFFSLVDPTARKKDFVVDLAVAAKWLGMTKGNLMRAVTRHGFERDVDFRVSKESAPGSGKRAHRRPVLDVMLTTDCFKGLCMLVNTPKSKLARSYYIAIEETLLRYRQEVERALGERIEQLERNQRSAGAAQGDAPGVVYILRAPAGKTTAHKLGMTSDLAKRLRSHQSALADDLDVVFVFKTQHMKRVEACAKAVLKGHEYRKYKEVYSADLGLLKKVISQCEDICAQVVTLPKGRAAGAGLVGGAEHDHFLAMIPT